MSIHSVEHALYDLGIDSRARKAFVENAEDFLARYQLSSEERAMLCTFDVKGMIAHGANPMLAMGYWATNEKTRSLKTYVEALQKRNDDHG